MMVTLGDGICDLELNTDDCQNDYGDCCEQDSGEICEEILDIGLDYTGWNTKLCRLSFS